MKKTLIVVAAGLLVAACAGSADPADTTTGATTPPAAETTVADTTPPETTPAETTAPPTDGPAARINISGSAFSGPVTVAVGETVEVTNSDSIPHTWTSDDDLFDSGSLGQGDTFDFAFDEAGEFAYHCDIHPTMTGTVTVEG